MRNRRWLVPVAAVLAASGVAQPAHAAEPSEVPGVVVRADDGAVSQQVVLDGLFPSARRQAVLLLEGDAREEARRMKVRVQDLRQLENGCNRPEQRASDATCDGAGDQGELADFVAVTLQAGRETDPDSGSCEPSGSAASATLAELVEGDVIVGLPDDDGVLCVVATFEHLVADDDNLTQTDSATFALGLSLDGVVATEVLGAQTSDGGIAPTPDLVVPTAVHAGVLELRGPQQGRLVPLLAVLGGLSLLGAAALLLRRQPPRRGRQVAVGRHA